MNTEKEEFDLLDKLALISSFIQFQTLGDTNDIQRSLKRIEDKLDQILIKLEEKK